MAYTVGVLPTGETPNGRLVSLLHKVLVLLHKYFLFIFPRTCILDVSVSVRRRLPRLRVELARARRHREI